MVSSTQTCPNCGAKPRFGARFCAKCGAPIYVPPPPEAAGSRLPVGRYIVFGVAVLLLAFGAGLTLQLYKPTQPFDQTKYEDNERRAVQKTLQDALGAPEKTTKLELNGGKLSRLPLDFAKLQNLRELAIHDNSTLDFASTLSLLAGIPGLARLDLAETDLKELPPEIGNLGGLKELLLWHNELKTLPPEIGQLKHLEWINLAQNSIESLPSNMVQLRSLTHLDLSQNGLTSVPAVVYDLPNLKSLDLSKNYGLTSLSSQIGKLRDLEFLGLAFDSELKSLPAEIAQLVKLQEITGLDAGFVESPDFEQLKQSMKNTRISGSR